MPLRPFQSHRAHPLHHTGPPMHLLALCTVSLYRVCNGGANSAMSSDGPALAHRFNLTEHIPCTDGVSHCFDPLGNVALHHRHTNTTPHGGKPHPSLHRPLGYPAGGGAHDQRHSKRGGSSVQGAHKGAQRKGCIKGCEAPHAPEGARATKGRASRDTGACDDGQRKQRRRGVLSAHKGVP